MKTLVTGGTGLLGSYIVEALLAQGYEVRALARKTSDITHLKTTAAEIVYGDVSDYDSLPSAVKGVGIVFHAAGKVTPGWGKWEEFENTTVKGTENILRASVESGVPRFLYVSSHSVLGKSCLTDTPADETAPCDLEFSSDTYYDYSKMKAEQVALDYHKQGKIKVSIIRPAMIYGPRDRLLTDRLYRQMSSRLIVWPGKSNPKCSPVFGSDVAELAILAATNEKAEGQVYHAVPAEGVWFKDFCSHMIKAQGGWRLQVTIPYFFAQLSCLAMEGWAKLRRQKDMPYLTRSGVRFLNEGMNVDGSKARAELGWEQKVSMAEGARLYVQWKQSQDGK